MATRNEERPLLQNLYNRGITNGLDVEKISGEELREIEPHVQGTEAIRVPSTGIVNYKQTAKVFASKIRPSGGTFKLNSEVLDIRIKEDEVEILTTQGVLQTRQLINCGGLYSDRLAEMTNIKPDMRIIPFRGELLYT